MEDLVLNLLFILIGAIVVIYDIITLPIYLIFQQPWKRWKQSQVVWARRVNEKDPLSPYKSTVEMKDKFPNVETLHELFQWSLKTYGRKKFLGTREVHGVDEQPQEDGKIFKKLILGNYKWMSMLEADETITHLARGLRELGLKPKDKLVFLSETRAEWLLMAHACFKTNLTVATLYTNLGDDGLIHAINEGDTSYLLISDSVIPKVKKIISTVPHITHIIYLEGRKSSDLTGFPQRINTTSFSQLQNLGRNSDVVLDSPSSQDIAVLMYTSGSTGVPKGVLFTHKCLMAATRGIMSEWSYFVTGTRVYPAYLPLAHILELLVEHFCISQGTPIAYSSALTLMRGSTGIKAGCKSDLEVLKPEFMAAVPLMLHRIRKGINEVINSKGNMSKKSFSLAMKYKKFWTNKGFQTPILNRLVFRDIRKVVGGNMKQILTGSAPLSRNTQEFVELCLGVKTTIAYALTETTGCGAITRPEEMSPKNVGPPIPAAQIRLAEWSEGNYYPTDKPYPRGEVVIGSDGVSAGYYKNEELTKESYKEENGIRWFYTGDIGEIHPDGTLTIIDRKKDLVKLQFGEYVSLGKIESQLLTCSLVDSICVFGSGYSSYVVALVVPNNKELRIIATTFNKENLSYSYLCNDPQVSREATKIIQKHAEEHRLQKVEIPAKIKLCSEEWSPETGLTTASFKVKRKAIQEYYKETLNVMMGSQSNGVNST